MTYDYSSGVKPCSKCKETKPLDKFNKQKKGSGRLRSWCQDCAYAARGHTPWDQYLAEKPPLGTNPANKFHSTEATVALRKVCITLQVRYGITLADHNRMLAEQGGGCAICGVKPGKRRHHTDHCHASGRVRGILCGPCNTQLAALENTEWRTKAEQYLQKS